jgi:hypothetical protein
MIRKSGGRFSARQSSLRRLRTRSFFLDVPGNAARREVRGGENAFHEPAPFIAAVTDFYFELLAFRRQIQRLITN